VDDILAAMRARNRIVLLDACRDNPGFGKRMAKATRAVGDQGLAPIKAGDISGEAGVFIAFATAAGKVAQDGDGGHSPFTQALLENIKKPVSIDDMFSMVTRQVSTATGNAQRPYKYASLDSIVCLTGACSGGDVQTAGLTPVVPGVVRGLVPGAIDLNDPNWLLVAWGDGARGYIEPRSIKKIGDRTVVHKKIFTNEGAVSDINIAFDCKTQTAGGYAGVTIKDGQKVPKSEFLFAPDVIALQPINKGSFYDAAAAFACDPARVQPETPEGVLFSPDWIAVALDAQGVRWSVLPSSIKKTGRSIMFLARQEAAEGAPAKSFTQIASLDAALPNLYAVVVLKGSIDCDAAELRSYWSEGWTKEHVMTGKIISEDSLPPLKITNNKVVADIGAYVCIKAGKKLVIP
jgi:hypothetical protein